MSAPAETPHSMWAAANQRCLDSELALVRAWLGGVDAEATQPLEAACAAARRALPAPSALDQLVARCGLSPFERAVLVAGAGVELEGNPAAAPATFGRALAQLPGAHWSALAPDAPLRFWRLLEVAPQAPLAAAPLRLDEHVLHYLLGLEVRDERLAPYFDPVDAVDDLPPSYRAAVTRLSASWSLAGREDRPEVAQLVGRERWAQRAVASAAARARGLRLAAIEIASLPADPAECLALQRLADREALLGAYALLLVLPAQPDEVILGRLRRWLRASVSLSLVSAQEPVTDLPRAGLRLDLARPPLSEQAALWRASLGAAASTLAGQVDALTTQFDLGVPVLRTVARGALEETRGAAPKALAAALWDHCRRQARGRLHDLAERLETRASWDDLVLPPRTAAPLRALLAQVRQRVRVHEEWGFAARSPRGLGLSAMFHGPSGTGKTLAAEVLASELRLDLYRIDLSQVVSKYIGETEKNLARVFDAAEEGGAVLLFDEADALFGKRSEVRDSHDRYANIEVSYLLQRMENYRGLALLTTNRREALDPAFVRRLRFIVAFPYPDAATRAEIWRRVFPAATPTEGLDPARLARLEAPGGVIRNIALTAAFLAAESGGRVRMPHLREAAQMEFAKLEKSLPPAATEDWT